MPFTPIQRECVTLGVDKTVLPLRDLENDAAWLREIADSADEIGSGGNQMMWPETRENLRDIATYIETHIEPRSVEQPKDAPQGECCENGNFGDDHVCMKQNTECCADCDTSWAKNVSNAAIAKRLRILDDDDLDYGQMLYLAAERLEATEQANGRTQHFESTDEGLVRGRPSSKEGYLTVTFTEDGGVLKLRLSDASRISLAQELGYGA